MKDKEGRDFLKAQFLPPDPLKDSDQNKGIPMPPYEDAFDEAMLIALPDPKQVPLKMRDIVDVIGDRRSRRKLSNGSLSLEALSFLLWATQGNAKLGSKHVLRTVPSAGNRHPFDTVVHAHRVEGLAPGLYRYIPSHHALLPVPFGPDAMRPLDDYVKSNFDYALALYWVARPYRGEWRYVEHSYKLAALDAGHIGQNAYLAAEALGINCCAVAGYMQEEIDKFLGLDGEDAFACYYAVFG